MADRRVLFISPTPTHPATAGNRQHIKSLVHFFKKQNYEAHFLYLAYEDYNENDMRSFFGKNIHIISKKDLYSNKKTFRYIYKKLKSILDNQIRKFQYLLHFITRNQLLYNSEADAHFSVFVKPVIQALQDKHHFNIVVCEYAFMSKSLTYFDNSVFKILDTNDRFTDRFQTYLDAGVKPSWVSLFKSQEKKALNRGDLILSVHPEDANYFSSLSGKRTAIFNYIPELTSLPQKDTEKRLLYIASGSEQNLTTIQAFIKITFPLIIQQHPDAQLIIGGGICDKLIMRLPNILLKGLFDDLGDFYSLGDIVINPEISGTGYKVKAMEALSYGMPLVATTAGAAGVICPFENHLFIADTPKDFAEAINQLFTNNVLLKQTSINAHIWVKNYKGQMEKNMTSAILNENIY